MKRSVYITGISCAILMLVGCTFKIMHWPLSDPMLICSVFLFCFWFLPTGLMNSYNSLPLKKMKTLHIVSFLVFAFCMMGVLFKVMHWPGAGMFLLLGLTLPFVVFLPVYLYHTREEEKTRNKNFFALTLGLTFLAVFSVFLVMTTGRNLLMQGVDLVSRNEANTELYHESLNNENEISRSANDVFNYTNELKCLLLTTAGENMCSGNKPPANYVSKQTTSLDNVEVVKKVFIWEEGNARGIALKEKINAFSKTVLASKNTSPELAELTKLLFDTNDNNRIYDPGIPWEYREFDNYPLIFTLDFLSKLQNNVRLVEGEALK